MKILKKAIHKYIFNNLPIWYDYLCKEKNNYQQLNDGSVLKGTRRLFTWRDENPLSTSKILEDADEILLLRYICNNTSG